MINTIAKKEFTSSLRDKRFLVLSLITFILLSLSLLVSYQANQKNIKIQKMAQQKVDDQFKNQPGRHPHRVVHYGSFVFRPRSPLSFLDFGLDSFTGNSIYIEGHKQNSTNFGAAEQSTSLIRFGELTPALVLQILFPLLIIFLTHGAFPTERQNGTLKLLLSQGMTFRKIAWEKIKGYSKIIALILLPGLLLITPYMTESPARLMAFAIVYAIYFFVIISVSVVISSYFSKESSSLLCLLSLWFCACILVPKMSANIGANLYPAPTKAEMDFDIHHEVSQKMDGHNSKDEKAQAFKDNLLKKYNVKTLAELPINVDGLIMSEGEAQSSAVYNEHVQKLNQIYLNQNSISSWLSLVNPYLAIRHLSMAIAGNDFSHFTNFQDQTEAYRFQMIQYLNNLQITKLKFGDKRGRLSQDTWSEIKPFEFKMPTLGWSLSHHLPSVISLFLWVGALLFIGLKNMGAREVSND